MWAREGPTWTTMGSRVGAGVVVPEVLESVDVGA